MNLTRIACVGCTALLLASCTGQQAKDYDSTATCQAQGLKPGTAEYDTCVREESAARLMQQQHDEYENTKWQQEYYRNQRSTY